MLEGAIRWTSDASKTIRGGGVSGILEVLRMSG